MSDMSHINPNTWDRLLDFLYECDASLGDDVVEQQLADHGIDVTPAVRRVKEMIETKRMQEAMHHAQAQRLSTIERLRNITSPHMEDLRQGLQQAINQLLSGEEQAAYFHKLEEAASEEDLRSLLDDLERLRALDDLNQDDTSSR